MKGLADFSFALLLLVDLALGLSGQSFPGLRVMNGGSRRTHQRQQASRLPLYMMQLYRTMLIEDQASTPTTTAGQTWMEDNPGLHNSDSVISLVAKSEYSSFVQNSVLVGYMFFYWKYY